MTLGPAAIVCAYADHWRGVVKDMLLMFGRVPFAFYVAHFFLIHALSVLCGALQGFPGRGLLHLVGHSIPRVMDCRWRASTWCGCRSSRCCTPGCASRPA